MLRVLYQPRFAPSTLVAAPGWLNIESSTYFYWLNIEVSATAHSLHLPWHLLSKDYFKVFQSRIQLLQAFFYCFPRLLVTQLEAFFCSFSFSTVNFCSSISAKYLTRAFLMELIRSIVHGNFRTPQALINSSSRS